MNTGFCPVCFRAVESEQIVCRVQPLDGPPCLAHVTCAYPDMTADEMACYPSAREASEKFKEGKQPTDGQVPTVQS